MNHSSPGSLTLKRALLGFLQAKEAEALSPRTIETYRHHLESWVAHGGDRPVTAVTTQDLRAYLAYLRTEYQPQRITGKTHPLSPKTLRNVYITLASFFRWLGKEFGIPSPLKAIPAPKFQEAEVEPFTQQQVEAMLKAVEYTRETNTRDGRRFTTRRPTAMRDRALILVLLDTGLRASELCALNIGDIDQRSGKIEVKHGQAGGAKGGKGRSVYLGKVAGRALWRYLLTRDDVRDPTAPLFILESDRRMRKTALLLLIKRLGQKVGITKSYPHRFRHTFAITYLRSGGDIFTLQKQLGHSSLDMVKHYARIAQVDVEQAHRRASPADNWRL
ncbi:MAG: tyrosine-type recombinase/integrase [Anaerolineales bacterium]